MAQPLHNPLSLVKTSNSSQTSVDHHERSSSRSGNFLRAISLHSPHPSTPNQTQATSTQATASTSSAPTTKSSSNNDESCENSLSCNPDDFEIKNPIGYGSSAVVYNAIFKPKNMRVAIKMIDLDLFERNQIDELRRETALMALSKHPNVLRVYGSFVKGSKLYIVTPYLSGGSCLDIMKNGFPDGFEEVTIATILKQTLEGLVYLHKNNHIHRDVKAGNLLMDDQGTVLLADFGVSSSLTENNELRKTFVGTPCWMAPEVMEQSGYDFKADIWSFGITSIELATGHAPFAKFAPMKVLMMTLNQEPPTLDRDHTKHKYSRTFKEMIDLCLQKDPTKRPTAEKLLSHPFFKQAKKKEYLIKAVLQQVPPLDERPHKMAKFKQIVIENTAQWDFDTPAEEEERDGRGGGEEIGGDKLSSNPKPLPTPTQKHISFGDVTVKSDKIELPSPAPSEQDIISPAPVRKSRFVIEEAADNNTVHSQQSVSPNNLSTHSSELLSNNASIFTQLSTNPSTAESSWQSSIGLGLGISSNIPSEGEVKKGRFSVNQQQSTPKLPSEKPEHNITASSTPTQSTTTSTTTSNNNNATITNTTSTNLPQTPIQSISEAQIQEILPVSMSRITSNESLKGERKSRFEIQHNPPPQPANNTSSPAPNIHGQLDYVSIPRESTRHQRNISRESANSIKVSRFSIEKEDANPQQESNMVHPYESPATHTPLSTTTTATTGAINTPVSSSIPPGSPPEYRKKGRFELSGNITPAEKLESTPIIGNSPRASITASLMAADLENKNKHDVHYQVETLLKQNEMQRNMLQDLLHNLNVSNTPSLSSRGRSASADFRKLSTASSSDHTIETTESKQTEISSAIERLQQLLSNSNREKERLSKENEALRNELEKVRKQLHAANTAINSNATPNASILRSSTVSTPQQQTPVQIQQPSQPSSILKSPSFSSSIHSIASSQHTTNTTANSRSTSPGILPSTPSVSLTTSDMSRPSSPANPTTQETHVISFKEP